MKVTKFALAALVAGLILATGVNSATIGRSGGSSGGGHSSSSSSHSSASVSRPSAPAAAPAPAHSGIGGTQGSVGVRKSEVTQPVAQQVRPATPTPAPTSTGAGAPAAPTYSASAPVYSAPAPVSNGSTFMSSLGGSFAGTVLGNMIAGNHGNGGTTVINNGGGAGVPNSGVAQSGPSVGPADAQFNPGGLPVQPKKEYTMWSFIGDAITFVILIAVLVGLAWILYRGFKMIREYVSKERGVSNQPFNPTQRFWEIQKAFGAADVATLNSLLGPDVVDELTRDLQPVTVLIKGVSHEVRLNNSNEFSVWYKFTDGEEEVNQVWHYERFGKEWKLNGIENV